MGDDSRPCGRTEDDGERSEDCAQRGLAPSAVPVPFVRNRLIAM